MDTMNLPIELNMTEAQLKQLAVDYDPKNIPEAKEKGDEAYQQIHSRVMAITKVRGNLEKRRKELKADALEFGRNLDGVAKGYRETLESLESPWRKVKTDIDEAEARIEAERAAAEAKRMEEIEARIAGINKLTEGLIGYGAAGILAQLTIAQNTPITEEWFGDYVEAANTVKNNVIEALTTAHDERVTLETQQAEQKTAQAEFDKRQAEQQADYAKQQAALEAQREEQAKTQRELDAKKTAQQAAENAERDRKLAAEQQARELAESKERAIRGELERKEQAERDAEAKAKKAAAAKARQPEAIKLLDYLQELMAVTPPKIKDAELQAVLADITISLADIQATAEPKLKQMKEAA